MKNEATLNENNQVVIGNKKLPTKTKISLRQSAGQGMEKITAKDQKLPILKLLHSSSPVLESNIQGSGRAISLVITSTGTQSPYSISGFSITYQDAGYR